MGLRAEIVQLADKRGPTVLRRRTVPARVVDLESVRVPEKKVEKRVRDGILQLDRFFDPDKVGGGMLGVWAYSEGEDGERRWSARNGDAEMELNRSSSGVYTISERIRFGDGTGCDRDVVAVNGLVIYNESTRGADTTAGRVRLSVKQPQVNSLEAIHKFWYLAQKALSLQ